MRRDTPRWLPLLSIMAGVLLLTACQKQMRDDGRIKPYEPNAFFENEQSARTFPEGVVPAQGEFLGYELEPENVPLNTGRDDAGDLLTTIPITITAELLERGRERYDIFCSPCHGLDGYGQGIVVQRGYPQPPSLHEERLVQAPVGYYFDVITNGFGVMYPYNTRLASQDRWAVSAYIRALQLSQNVSEDDVPPGEEIQDAP